MVKKLISLALVVCLTFSLVLVASANQDTNTSLTKKEHNILINKVGLQEEELSEFPVSILRTLIESNAVKISNSNKTGYKIQDIQNSSTPGLITTNSLTTSDITLWGTVFSVTSDIAGSKKIYVYGKFDWNIEPTWKLTDAFSIGYPVTNKWYLKTSNGQILGHESKLTTFSKDTNTWVDGSIVTTPADWDNGAGVGAKYDLGYRGKLFKGYISQYVYVNSTESGTSNIKLRYGHQYTGGTIGFGVYPYGLSVNPGTFTETLDYALTFSF